MAWEGTIAFPGPGPVLLTEWLWVAAKSTLITNAIAKLSLLIVAGIGPTLMGRDWLSQIRLDWQQINQVHNASLQAVLVRYPAVFQEGLGTLKGYQAKIYVDPDAVPRFQPTRSVPYALRDKVNQELKRFQD